MRLPQGPVINLCCLLLLSLSQPERINIVISELVHCGRKLKDDLTLDACGILSGSTIHVLKKTWPETESSAGLCV